MAEELSKQAQACLQCTTFTGSHFRDVRSNRYHPTNNPEGVADLGLAENKLCADLLIEKMSAIARQPEPNELLYYEKATGNVSFRQSMKEFIERTFHPREKISWDTIFITNGVTVILEAFAFAFADPGDYIMVPSPYYYRTKLDIFERPGAHILDVPLTFIHDGDSRGRWTLSDQVLEDVYQKAVSEGKRVRAVMLNNPVNPTGDVIGEKELLDLLDFVQRHKLHLLSNEIYGLSVHDPDVQFTSILSLPHTDPERVHFTWGISKDTGLSGYRCGFIHTKNPAFLEYLNNTLIYFRAAGIIQHRLQAFLNDQDWLDQIFFPTMKKRMSDRFNDLRVVLEEFGVHVHPGSSTIFMWANFSKYLPEPTFAGEQQLFLEFLKEKVFIVPGCDSSFHSPGWFRIVYSIDESVYQKGKRDIITVLRRLQKVHDGC